MANTNSPFGFKPISKIDGSPFHGQVYPFLVPSTDGTALYIGDPVIGAGSANATVINGYKIGVLPTVTKATAGATNKILGYVVAVEHPVDMDDSLRKMYRVASTNTVILVALANDLICEVQADEDIEVADIGLNANYVAGSGGSTTSGYSSAQLDSSSVGANATYQLTIFRMVNRVDNAMGDYCKVEVFTNLPQIAPATAGV